jgi:nicotinamidase-related amidase
MRDYIKEDDTVRIDFHGAQTTLCVKATVLHVPIATGDSWIFRDQNTSQIHYISEGCTITKEPL